MNTVHRTMAFIALLSISGLLAFGTGSRLVADEGDVDPVVEAVVEMLRAGVAEAVVIEWLESTANRPRDIGPRGIIALTEASASEELITFLLESLDSSEKAPVAEPAPAPESVDAPAPTLGGRVEVVASLAAKRIWVEEESPDMPREERWTVVLYQDGELVAWTRPDLRGEPITARLVVEAGRRELRVVLERHQELGDRWSHESLAVPTLIAYEASPGEPIEVEIEMVRIWGLWRDRQDGGPLRYAIRQGEHTLAENSGTGGDPDRWRPICEDVEANFPDSDRVPNRFRNDMSRCVRWPELWNGYGRSSSRVTILNELAAYDYAPPIR